MYSIVLLIFILIILLIPLLRVKKRGHAVHLALIVFFYFLTFCCFLLYISKDFGHLFKVLNYFSYSPGLIKNLIMLPISRIQIARFLNLFSVCFLYTNVLFAIHLLNSFGAKARVILRIILGVLFLIELLLYDPDIHISLYKTLYPAYLRSETFTAFYKAFKQITMVINMAALIGCICSFIISFIQSPKIRAIRQSMAITIISYVSLITTYALLLYWSPTLLIRYSKVADDVTYVPLSLSLRVSFYSLFPYILLILFFTFVFSSIHYHRMKEKIVNSSLEVMHNVNGATVASRLFCHYMKNELLSISAMLEEIPVNE